MTPDPKINSSNDPILGYLVPCNQGLDSSSKIPSPDKSKSLSKSGSASTDENLFDDLPTFKETTSNIQTKSEEIRVQCLTALSAEPPRWETLSATLFSKSQNDASEDVDDGNLVLSPVLNLSSREVDSKNDFDRPLS